MKHILVPVDLLSELAESLACELDARYPASVRSYESQDRKYMAEMEPVTKARQIIAAPPAVHGETGEGVPDYINGAIDNLALDNYELDYSGYLERKKDIALIRAYVARTGQPAEQQQPCRQSPPDDPLGGLEHRADGEANFHTLSRSTGSWVARIQFNGELHTHEQERILNAMLGDRNVRYGDGYHQGYWDARQESPDVAALLTLLEHAQCPNCDGSGARYDSHGEPEQCQWCCERDAALAVYRKQGGDHDNQ